MVIGRLRRRCGRGVAGDAVDQVPDVEVEQRVGLGRRRRRPGRRRVALRGRPRRGGSDPALDRAEADRRPHQQPARLHRGVGVRSRRARIASTSGRDASTNASRPGQRMSRLSRRRPQPRAQLAAPSAPRSRPTARRRTRGGARSARRRSAIASTSASLLPIRLYSGTGETPSRVDDAAHAHRVEARLLEDLDRGGDDLVGVEVEVGRLGRGLHGTITSLPTTARSAMRWSAVGQLVERRPSRDRVAQAAVGDEAGEPRVDVVELGAGLAAGEHADERRCSRRRGRARRSSGHASAGEADREQPAVRGRAPRPRPRRARRRPGRRSRRRRGRRSRRAAPARAVRRGG